MKKQLLTVFKSDLAKIGSIIFIASLSSNLILFLANLFVADKLGSINFGVFKTVTYLFAFLPLLIGFGTDVSMTKYIAEFGKNKEKIGYLIKWFLKLRIVGYLFLIALTVMFREQISLLFLKDPSFGYLILAGIFLATLSFFNVFQNVVLGFQKFKLYALSQFLSITSSAVLGVLLSPFGLFYVILGWGSGSLIGNLPCIIFLSKLGILKKTKKFDVKTSFFRFSIPMYATAIINGLFASVTPLLSLFFSQEKIGYFSFAFLFYFATLLIPSSLSSILFPKVSEMNGLKRHREAKDILRRAFELYGLVAIIGILFVLLLSDWLFVSFFKNYLTSLFMFKVLTILGFALGFNTIYVSYLQGLGRMKKFVLLNLLQNVILILVSFALLI
jgi:O-antigen/teichoic acid export membrane protein